MSTFPRTLLSLAVAATLSSQSAVAAEEGHEEGAGNNLSTPVIWSDGIAKILRTFNDNPIATLLTGVSSVCTDLPEETCYLQKDEGNIWQAESWDATTFATSYANAVEAPSDGFHVDEVDWGDNLEARDWSAHSKVRVETVLWQTLGGGNHDLPALKAYEMSYLSGKGPDEMWGTTGATIDSTEATVYSDCARLTIQKIGALDDEIPVLQWDAVNSRWGDLPVYFSGAVWEAGDGPGFYSSEINISGKVIYGYNWNVGTEGDGDGIYRLTFSLDGSSADGQQCHTNNLNTWLDSATIRESVEEGEEEPADDEDHGAGGGTAVIDAAENLSYMDIRIQPAGSGSGGDDGGGGGHSGGGGGGPVVSQEFISISGATGFGGTFLSGDKLVVSWNNGPDGDNHRGVKEVTADFSALGGDPAVTAIKSDGIWTASFTLDSNTTSGTGLSVAITATSSGDSATGASAANISVDVVAPTLSDTNPRDNSVNASSEGGLVLYFSEAVLAGDKNNKISFHSNSSKIVESIPANDSQVKISGSTVKISPRTQFIPGISYYVTIERGAFTDAAGNAFESIIDSTVLNFAVEEPLPPLIEEHVLNTDILIDPFISASGGLEGGLLSGTVTSAGLIQNVSLGAATVVQGGQVGGTIIGDPARPALINASITAGTELSNVVIAAGARIDPDVAMGANVSFQTLANVPPGMDLTTAQGGSPWLHDSAVLALDLDHSLVVSGAQRQSLLEAVQMLDEFNAAEIEVMDGSGELSVRLDESRSRLLPIALHRAASGAEPGTSIDEDGRIRIVTESGLELTSLPLIDDVETLLSLVDPAVSPLTLEFDANGYVVARNGAKDSEGGFWLGRGDMQAVKSSENGAPGMFGQTSSGFANGGVYTLVYEVEDGSLYQQDILPAPADWGTLKSTLQSLSGASAVQMDARGLISVRLDGQDYRGRPGYYVTEGTVNGSTDNKVIFSAVGDINGDGTNDVQMLFPNGHTQLLYMLP